MYNCHIFRGPGIDHIFFHQRIKFKNFALGRGVLLLEALDVGIEATCALPGKQVSHEKKGPYFPLYTGCVIGMITMVYDNPHIIGYVVYV